MMIECNRLILSLSMLPLLHLSHNGFNLHAYFRHGRPAILLVLHHACRQNLQLLHRGCSMLSFWGRFWRFGGEFSLKEVVLLGKKFEKLLADLTQAPDVRWFSVAGVFHDFRSHRSIWDIYLLDDLVIVLLEAECKVEVDQFNFD